MKVFRSSPENCAIHSLTGWFQLDDEWDATVLPVYDPVEGLFGRMGRADWLAWCATNGFALCNDRDIRAMAGVSHYIPPVTLPTLAMLTQAGVPKPWQDSRGADAAHMAAYRAENMSSREWCVIHDFRVFELLLETEWNGHKPVDNAGKLWVGGNYNIFGWRKKDGSYIQPPSHAHADGKHTDYATLARVKRQRDRPTRRSTPIAMKAVTIPPPSKIPGDLMPATPNTPNTPNEPEIITTQEWGAQVVKTMPVAEAVGIVVHHMANPSRAPREGAAEVLFAKTLAQRCQRDHMEGRGWSDTGQHFTISRGGIILEGRTGSLQAARNGEVVKGAHAGASANRDHFGIECEGTYHITDDMPAAQWDALVRLVRWLCETGDVDPDRIRGHRQVPGNKTVCPGLLLERLPDLRAALRRS